MFAVAALALTIALLVGLLLEDRVVARDQSEQTPTAGGSHGLGRAFFLLLLVALTSGIGFFVSFMGRSWAMSELGFTVAAISTAFAVSFAVGLPLRPVFGWLSDRVVRKRLMAVSYATGAAGLLGLALSESVWHFWDSAAIMGISPGAEAVVSVLVTDLLPPESLGAGMSLYGATGFAAGILGFAGTGHAIQVLEMTPCLILAAFLQGLAIFLLIPIRVSGRAGIDSRKGG